MNWKKGLTHLAVVIGLAATLAPIGYGIVEANPGRKGSPCAADLDHCPSRGCAKAGTPDALLNQLKRTMPQSDTPTLLTLDDFELLQNQADNLVGQKATLGRTARSQLRKLNVSSGQISEGALVEVTAYIVGLERGLPRANKSGESVNCRLKGTDNNDFHIPIARAPEDTEFDGIVVEMIPQNRPEGWSISMLKRVARESRPVLVRGQLFYDNKHLVNDDPIEPISGQPARFSLWEIHPVTEFLVCMRPDKTCNSGDATQWEKLEKLQR